MTSVLFRVSSSRDDRIALTLEHILSGYVHPWALTQSVVLSADLEDLDLDHRAALPIHHNPQPRP